MYKVIIAGGRGFNKYVLLSRVCDSLIDKKNKVEIVSGCARGADKLGELYAESNNIPIKRFPADWDRHGKSAGYLRNKQMAEYADALIAFWDGNSRGTKHMIDLAKKEGIGVTVIGY